MFNRTASTPINLEAQAALLTGPTTDFAAQAAEQAAGLASDAKKARKYTALSAQFAEHQRELQKLSTRFDRLQKTSPGRGFPWSLLLLVGGAYALYRSNETVRTQVKGVLSKVMPNQKDGQGQETQNQGTSPAPVGTSMPTVNAGMTPGGSGNDVYGMGGASSPDTSALGSATAGNLGGTAPTPSMGNQSVSTDINSKNNDKLDS